MNFGFSGEMLFIFLLALILFGPKKLPEIGRQIGKALAEFRRASNEFKSQLEAEMRQIELEETLRKEKEELTQTILPPDNTVATGYVSADIASVEGGVLPLPAADSSAETAKAEAGAGPDGKVASESKLPEDKEPEMRSAVAESSNG